MTRTSRYPLVHRLIASVLTGALLAPASALAAPPDAKPAAPAASSSKPTLAVVAVPLEDLADKHAARISYYGEQTAADVGRFDVQPLADLLDPQGKKARTDNAAEARASYEAAKKAYDDLDVQKAVDACDHALALYEKTDLSETFDDMTQAWMLKIAALIANADEKGSQAEIGALLPLDPRVPFDPNVFPPELIAKVKKKQTDLRDKSKLGLDVSTMPVSARVFVNGVYRGVSPVEIKGLAPGESFVTMVAPGYKRAQKRVKAGNPATLGEQLETASRFFEYKELVGKLRNDMGSDARINDAAALAKLLGVDQVLVVSVVVKNGGPFASAFRADAKNAELGSVEQQLPDDEKGMAGAVDGFLRPLLSSDGKKKVASSSGPTSTGPTGGSSTGNAAKPGSGGGGSGMMYAGYALAGLGALGLIGGIGFGAAALSKQSEFRDAPFAQTNSIYSDIRSSGETYALMADVSWILAVLGGGAGGALIGLGLQKANDGQAPAGAMHDEEKEAIPSRPPPKGEQPAVKAEPPAPRPEPKPEVKAQPEPEKKAEPPAATQPAEPAPEKKAEPPPVKKEEPKKEEPKKKHKSVEDEDLRDDE